MSGSLRESVGKKDAKKTRSSGHLPCVLYGGKEQIHFTVDEQIFTPIIFTPDVYIIKLEIAGKTHDAILQEVQYHPVTDHVLHADFMELQPGKPITVALPLQMKGVPKGVLMGGKLQKKKRKLKVQGLVEHIPEYIEVDVTELNVGQSLRVEDIQLPNLQLTDAPRDMVVTVASSRAAAAPEPGETAAAIEEKAPE
jgi:large subunit ribosomal protein L25